MNNKAKKKFKYQTFGAAHSKTANFKKISQLSAAKKKGITRFYNDITNIVINYLNNLIL